MTNEVSIDEILAGYREVIGGLIQENIVLKVQLKALSGDKTETANS